MSLTANFARNSSRERSECNERSDRTERGVIRSLHKPGSYAALHFRLFALRSLPAIHGMSIRRIRLNSQEKLILRLAGVVAKMMIKTVITIILVTQSVSLGDF